MGSGNYTPPVSRYSDAKYDFIYVDKENVYEEKYWENEYSDFHWEYEDFKEELITFFENRFKSFRKNDKEWMNDRCTKIIAENDLCMLTVSDNDCYIAVSVISKESDYDNSKVNLANRHIESYAKALKEIVLDMYGEYSVRACAWTSEVVKREDKVA